MVNLSLEDPDTVLVLFGSNDPYTAVRAIAIVVSMSDRANGQRPPRVTVKLGPFSSEPFAQGLRNLLKQTEELDVVLLDDPQRFDRQVPGDAPSILILEGSDPAGCRTFLEASRAHAVVLIDSEGARAFVGLDNPDWRLLVDVIKAVSAQVTVSDPAAAGDRAHVIDLRRLPPAGAQGADSVALAPLGEWLQLSLGLCLMRRAGHDHAGIPGWSVAPREALESLGLDRSSTSVPSLAHRLRTIDDDLMVSRGSLPTAVAEIAGAFSLTELELRLLCLVLAPEIDGRYATVIGVLQDDLTRRRPGLTLLAELMFQTAVATWDLRRTVHASHSIVAKGLVRPEGFDGLSVDIGIEPSRAVVAHLLGSSVERAAADVGATLRSPVPHPAPPLSTEETELARQLDLSIAESSPLVRVVGGGRAKRWFGRLTASIGLPLVVGDIELLEPGPARVTAVGDWMVLSCLQRSALLVLGVDALELVDRQRVADRLLQTVRSLTLVAVDAELPVSETALPGLVLCAPTIAASQRADWWSSAASSAGLPLTARDTERLAATVTIDPAHIDASLAVAARRRSSVGAGGSTVELVQRAARELVPTPLPPGIRRIEPTYDWDDIVLADASKQLLQAISMHVLQAGRVLEEWGFASRVPYGQGVAALFSGPSGTGKTMSAQIIAGDLGVDLLQVDLSKTVSKYIGETEKNLDRIFEAAEQSAAVLLFDEADAIFGKRTEIKDAHDRHANVEVAYLLQRMESFQGLAILTTNFKQNIDSAFVRRLRFVVEFSLPNAAQRDLIWRRAFPSGAPVAPDVDVSFLASRLQVPGGSIQNIALHAAFLAAADGGQIGSAHVLAATRRELVKIGMLTAERGLDELAV